MNLNANFKSIIGEIKPMHAINGAPLVGISEDYFHYISDAGIPYSRLHDVGGWFGGNMFVDIPNIFRDFDADENDPASYDFTFTDWLLSTLRKHGCDVVYRLGVTIENFHYVKAYRIFPPKDFGKWARVCEHIIKHYNEGWADGFHFGIKYWEIWNEPDNGRDDTENQMWHGTPQQFYELYTVTAKHLKKCFGDSIMVGGYATCGFRYIFTEPEKYGINCERVVDECYNSDTSKNFITFFEGFMAHIKKENAPLEFFSWHSYLTTERTLIVAEYVDRRLKEFGYENVETHLNEWNNTVEDRGNPSMVSEIAEKECGTSIAASKIAAMMCGIQKTKTKMLCYYDASIQPGYYAGLFDAQTRLPLCSYYPFIMFNELFKLKNQAEMTEDKNGIYSLAATDGDKKAILIANISENDVNIESNFDENMNVYLLDDDNSIVKTDLSSKSFYIKSYTTLLVTSYELEKK